MTDHQIIKSPLHTQCEQHLKRSSIKLFQQNVLRKKKRNMRLFFVFGECEVSINQEEVIMSKSARELSEWVKRWRRRLQWHSGTGTLILPERRFVYLPFTYFHLKHFSAAVRGVLQFLIYNHSLQFGPNEVTFTDRTGWPCGERQTRNSQIQMYRFHFFVTTYQHIYSKYWNHTYIWLFIHILYTHIHCYKSSYSFPVSIRPPREPADRQRPTFHTIELSRISTNWKCKSEDFFVVNANSVTTALQDRMTR